MNLTKLSKTISHALRHKLELYNLKLNKEGWVELEQLIQSLKKADYKEYKVLSIEDIEEVIKTSQKKRFEMKNGQIRAFYGHSIDQKMVKESTLPPDILYHGTIKANEPLILEGGLKPMNRQYVHLSEHIEEAELVAKRRKNKETIILTIKAEEAFSNGIAFYKEGQGIWLADQIPADYIKIIDIKQ
ncbi:putative RNA 2'-phosphotransferase [Flavobacteriaceae bacterium UJ101]|nr:putative RNA 2'-phosphotransferase [Flavobacteriaceae bacterium UJ101]